jgi:hypothetical protein
MPVNCSRGAPRGRSDTIDLVDVEEFDGKVKLQLLPMTSDGAYDKTIGGGAYWGCGSREHGWMFRAYYYNSQNGESVDMYIRALSREKAKAQVIERLPKARFYR